MKKIFSLLLLFSALFLVSCRFPNRNEAFYNIRIGVILPLSGEFSEDGRKVLDGIELAVRNCNLKGGVDFRKIQLIIRNSAGDPEKAAAAAKEMIENDNVVAVAGAYSNDEAWKVKLVAEEYGVPFITPTAASSTLAENTDYTFQSIVNDEFKGVALASYIAFERKFKKPAFLINMDDDSYYFRETGRKAAQAWADFAKREPLLLAFKSGQKSFAEQIKKCIYDDIDVIVFPAEAESAIRFIKEARKMKYNGGIAGTDSYNSKLLFNVEDSLGDCFFTSAYYPQVNNEENNDFRRMMKKEYNRIPDTEEAMGYDCIRILIRALKSSYTPDEIAMNLKNMRSFASVSGRVSYHAQKNVLLRPVFIFSCPGRKIKPFHRWTILPQQMKNYRNREEN